MMACCFCLCVCSVVIVPVNMVLNEILNPDDMYYVLRATMRDTGIERLKAGVVVIL